MGAGKKVLLAEGDRTSADQITAHIEASGNRLALMGTVSATEVVEAAKKIRPHLIILGDMSDRTQPGMAVRMLKSNPATCQVPVIILDRKPQRHGYRGMIRLEGLQLESEDYFTKPLDMASFTARLNQLLEGTGGQVLPAAPPNATSATWPRLAGA